MRARVIALSMAGCLAVAAGCGQSRPPASADTHPTSSVTPAGTPGSRHQQLTAADNGRTIRLTAGQAVDVVLATPGVMWDRPRALTSALRRSQASGGYPADAPARATFVAVHRGTSVIVSASDARCLHARPRCLIPQRLWRVTVVIR